MQAIRGNRIAMIFQEPMTSLNPVLTVGEQIAESIRHHEGATAAAAWDQTVKLIDRVGIPHAAKRVFDYPHAFSGGMRQRAMIAMSLAMKPDILIADEPTTALDVTIQAQILNLMREMQNDYKMAVILITHNLGVVAEICDEVIVMYAGKPAERTNIKQIFQTPSHPYTWGLLNSIPKLNEQTERLIPIEGQPPNLAKSPEGCLFAPRCAYAWDSCRKGNIKLLPSRANQTASCLLHDPVMRSSAPVEIFHKAQMNHLIEAARA